MTDATLESPRTPRDQQPPLTAVQRAYLCDFERFLCAGSRHGAEGLRRRMRALSEDLLAEAPVTLPPLGARDTLADRVARLERAIFGRALID